MEEIYVSPFAPNLTTRCYCLITRFPFFHFHFDFLFSLFGVFLQLRMFAFFAR